MEIFSSSRVHNFDHLCTGQISTDPSESETECIEVIGIKFFKYSNIANLLDLKHQQSELPAVDMFHGHLKRVMPALIIPANDKGFVR